MAFPGGGWIKLLSHADGPKMNFEFDGWFLPVFDPNGDSITRFRPS